MSQFYVNNSAGTSGPINTINNEPPIAGNFNITSTGGTIAITNFVGSTNLEVQGINYTYKNVNSASSPYSVLNTDDFISVDTSGGPVTLLFPNAPTANHSWVVKDRVGNSFINNITITTPGAVNSFDASTSYVLNTNYSSIQLLANSSNHYEVF